MQRALSSNGTEDGINGRRKARSAPGSPGSREAPLVWSPTHLQTTPNQHATSMKLLPTAKPILVSEKRFAEQPAELSPRCQRRDAVPDVGSASGARCP